MRSKNILLNGMNLKSGGGKNILLNFISEIQKNTSNYNWFILVPNKIDFLSIENKNIHYIQPLYFFRLKINFPFLYFIYFPLIIKILRINLILNFGDIIIPSKTKQIYFFDWAYAVYNDNYIWDKMKLLQKIQRRIKVLLIKYFIKYPTKIIVQTKNIKNRIELFYNLKNIKIIPTPVQFETIYYAKNNNNIIKYIIVPSDNMPHKNLNILVHLAKKIDELGLPYVIILTLDFNNNTKNLLNTIKENKLKSIKTYGLQSKINMYDLYKNADALLLPTLLESYGLPYIEAMAMGVPILTSDLDFAHDICQDAAIYFNPIDEISILNSIINLFDNDNLRKSLIMNGKQIVTKIPNWFTVYNLFLNEINLEINN
ncbi:MAG: glycosyltransferase [Bacteroidia bacterium]|nr:glycosyltransferase [Bacteroidia bacterium]